MTISAKTLLDVRSLRLFLGVLLCVAIGAAYFTSTDQTKPNPPAGTLSTSAAPSVIKAVAPRRSLRADVIENPFAPLNLAALSPVAPAPPPPVQKRVAILASAVPIAPMVPPAPTAPTAPPVPFLAIGMIHGKSINEGNASVFLQRGDNLVVAKQGDVIDGTYRIDLISPGRIDMTYLPLSTKQTITVQN